MAGQEFESSEKVVIKEGVAEQSFDAEDADSNCNNILVDDESESAEDEKLKEDKTRNTLNEHSSFAEALTDDSNGIRLEFKELLIKESEPEEITISSKNRSKLKDKDKRSDNKTIQKEKKSSKDSKGVPKTDTPLTVKEEKKLCKQINKDKKMLSKVEEKLEKAEKKLPTKKNIRFDKQFDPNKQKVRRKLRFEEEVKPLKKNNIITKGAKGVKKTVATTVSGTVHNQIAKYEEDNPTLKAVHGAEKVAESALYTAESALKTANHSIKTAPYQKVSKLKFQKEKAEIKLSYHKAMIENPELRKNRISTKAAMKKAQQKQNQVKNAEKTKKAVVKAKEVAEQVERKIVQAVASNKTAVIIVVIFIAVFAVLTTLGTSCLSSFVDRGAVHIATSYTSKESDIYSADNQLTNSENGLRDYINHIPDYYVGWSEYNYYLDDIGHDPYELISYLSAMKIAFKYDSEIQDMINEVYNEMYKLEIESVHEVRSHSYIEVDFNGNETEVTVYYDYYILNVRLESKSVEEVVIPKLQAAGAYDLYLAMKENKGNNTDLF